jgi:prevent-host-death family protein
MQAWQIQEAKAKLSELVKSAERDGPQAISVRGKTTAVVLSKRDYDRLRRRRPSFVELVRSSPLVGVNLELDRDRTPIRDVRL